jgi:hypothetical protein
VASPLFDVVEEKWDGRAKVLSGRSRVVAGERYELRIVHDGVLRREAFVPQTEDFSWQVRF